MITGTMIRSGKSTTLDFEPFEGACEDCTREVQKQINEAVETGKSAVFITSGSQDYIRSLIHRLAKPEVPGWEPSVLLYTDVVNPKMSILYMVRGEGQARLIQYERYQRNQEIEAGKRPWWFFCIFLCRP